MLAKYFRGSWYFKVTPTAWVRIGPTLKHLELVLQEKGICPQY